MCLRCVWMRMAVAVGFLATGCTTGGFLDRGVALDDRARSILEPRLAYVVFPVLAAATEWCPQNQELTYGFLLRAQEDEAISTGQRPSSHAVVQYVHPKSPAAAAGLRVGARILAVNAEWTVGENGDQVFHSLRKAVLARVQPLTLTVEDEGRLSELNIDGVWACSFSVHIVASDHINAYADGRRILLTSGMLRFLASDDELAFVLAHEIAHNALEHSQTTRLKSALEGFLAATTGEPSSEASALSRRSFEAQADYVGLQIVARAGFEVRAAGDFWRRLIQLFPHENKAQFIVTHPDTPDRLIAFERTVREIEEKIGHGQFIRGQVDGSGTAPAPVLSPH